MGWKVANWGSIAGDTGPLDFFYWWPNNNNVGENKGAQFAEANPETRGAVLANGRQWISLTDSGTSYVVEVTNLSVTPAHFALEGGEV